LTISLSIPEREKGKREKIDEGKREDAHETEKEIETVST